MKEFKTTYSKADIENAIKYFAEKYKISSSIDAMYKEYGIINAVKEIQYFMFLNEFNSYYCDDIEYQYYKFILYFLRDLRNLGYINYTDK